MEVHCTRPTCPRPQNFFADLDDSATLRTVQQKFCTACGMPLLLAGRYLPTRLLGKGGFGAAFLARDRYTPAMRECVVKQFQPDGDLNPSQLKMAQELFEREAQVLEELGTRHPQIPDLLAFFELDVPSQTTGKSDSFFYLVQEFIDGENLEEELERNGKFSEADVREVLDAILKVLGFVHDNHSIHRDIKPSNIMRRRDGRLFLLDFGAVKQITASAGAGSGKGSTGIYSMGFAPPEQMRGDVVYPATDLYALAVTCVTLLTGKQPNELYDAYSNEWKWQSFATVSDRLQTVLNRMLLPTPSQRYQSAKEVLSQLGAASAPPAPRSASSGQAAAKSAPSSTSLQPPAPAAPPAQSQPLQAKAANPAPLSPPQSAKPAHAAPPAKPFSLLEFLGGSAFAGFEGGLLAIALGSLLSTLVSPVLWVLWLGMLGGILFAQSRRWIERFDYLIIGVITMLLVVFVPWFHSILIINAIPVMPAAPILAIFAGLVGVLVGILFRLIYLIVSRLF